MKIPAFLIMRDRVSYARWTVNSLVSSGLDVHIVDHGTTWKPALDWLACSPYPVHYLGDRISGDFWNWEDLAKIVGNNRYVVTDPDTIPSYLTPNNWPEALTDILDRYPDRIKAGLGLRIDDLPDGYDQAPGVRRWEKQFWRHQLEPGIYAADVDTTIALYQPLTKAPNPGISPALRTGSPYLAKHLTWYEDSANQTAEQQHYKAHLLPKSTHWSGK